MSDEDRELSCADCGDSFAFKVGEQRFFAKRGLPDVPRRCAACRRKRKAERRDTSAREPCAPVVAPVATLPTCAWCGDPARVPFEVALHRPVACEPCYRWRLGLGSGLE